MGKAPLPADVWLEVGARTDLRWIDGDYSTRYRPRLEATRVFTAGGHTIVPHASAEWLYDTRYDGWARTLYKLGPEVTPQKSLAATLGVYVFPSAGQSQQVLQADEAKIAAFKKAFSSCLEGKKYTVKY